MSFYYIITSWLHILATVAWIGGMAFYILILIPSLGVLDPPQRGRLLGALIKRYGFLAWGSVIILLATGILITRSRIPRGSYFGSTYGILLGVKHILVLCMIVIGAIVSFVIGPKLKAQATAGPPAGTPGGATLSVAPKLQKRAGILGLLNFLLGIGLLLLTEVMRWI
jgi:uncharacterized membrane protein